MRATWNVILASLAVAAAVTIPLQAMAAVAVPPAPALGTISILDTQTHQSGVQSSAAIGTDGLGIVAYGVTPTGTNAIYLRVAHCDDPACTAVTTTDIDTGGFVGWRSSIKIGSDGLPLIVTPRTGTRTRTSFETYEWPTATTSPAPPQPSPPSTPPHESPTSG